MVSQFRFSPIKNKEELLEAIRYTHFTCFELLKRNFGQYLPVAGNIGIFCHTDDEYQFLTNLREEMTDLSKNWNKKYYRLHESIMIPARDDVPKTEYTYLYVRKPDQHAEVGDVDFVLDQKEYSKLRDSLLRGEKMTGIEIMDRPELDLLRVFDPAYDVLSFIGKNYMTENVKASH